MRLARAYDSADPAEAAFRRVMTAAGKFWVCKRAMTHIAEALECLGGAGYVEESPMPRLYREAPVNSVWEGSGNVVCLDVLRARGKDEQAFGPVLAEIGLARGQDRRLDAYVDTLERELRPSTPADVEVSARRLVEKLVLALQAALLVRVSPTAVADAFISSRIAGDWGHVLGTLPPNTEFPAIIDRARG
jgi:putative acyl-CoA dehydrogenase